jgi:hypothetical protein
MERPDVDEPAFHEVWPQALADGVGTLARIVERGIEQGVGLGVVGLEPAEWDEVLAGFEWALSQALAHPDRLVGVPGTRETLARLARLRKLGLIELEGGARSAEFLPLVRECVRELEIQPDQVQPPP